MTLPSSVQKSSSSSSSSSPPSSPNLYLVHFPLSHPTFRLPVFRSVAYEYAIPLSFYPLPSNDEHAFSLSYQDLLDSYDPSYQPEIDVGRPFAIVSLPTDREARLLLQKCSVVKSIVHLWSAGSSAQHLSTALQQMSSQRNYQPLQDPSLSWRADMIVIGVRVSQESKNQHIRSLHFLDFKGPVKMKSPDFDFVWYEERWGISGGAIPQHTSDASRDNEVRLAMAGRRILLPAGSTPARDWIERLDLKKRRYIGNTSMEAEMSLHVAQMALASSSPSSSKIIYDPFVGTGSLIIACAALGAYVYGSDIDGRMIKGKAAAAANKNKSKNARSIETGVLTAARQYGLQGKFLDCLTFDITQHPWRIAKEAAKASRSPQDSASPCLLHSTISSRRHSGFLDAIVADPPYGVRAGAKRLGHRDVNRQRTEPHWLEDRQGWSHEQEDYIPPTRPYALNDLLDDLLRFSATLVRVGGRLVFWMPVMNEDLDQGGGDGDPVGSVPREESRTQVPDGGDQWDLVAVSTQDFGKWARRLVTMQRRAPTNVTCTCLSATPTTTITATPTLPSSTNGSSTPSSSSPPHPLPASSCPQSFEASPRTTVPTTTTMTDNPESPPEVSTSPHLSTSSEHPAAIGFGVVADVAAAAAVDGDATAMDDEEESTPEQSHTPPGRYRANVDPAEFRNRYFKSTKMKSSVG